MNKKNFIKLMIAILGGATLGNLLLKKINLLNVAFFLIGCIFLGFLLSKE
ncbi:hypothetical protein ABGF48_05270 [Helcococcus bovis]